MTITPAYKVYGFAKSDRSGRLRWLLTELGLPFESQLLKWSEGDHDKPEYLAINPMGMVPTLTEDGKPIFESIAICLYLTDRYQKVHPLAPSPDSPLRAAYLQWCLFIGATLDARYNDLMYLRFGGDEARSLKERPPIVEDLKHMARILDKALVQAPYLVGGEFSTADILTSLIGDWMFAEGCLAKADCPGLFAYVERLKTRPAAIASGAFGED